MRVTRSASSPIAPARNPPSSTRMSRRNSPNAPEMISSPCRRDQPTRPSRNERRYSTTWILASHDVGMRDSTILPRCIVEPFAARTVPPVATTRSGSSTKGLATCRSASSSSTASASVTHTSGCWATLMPALAASPLLPALSPANDHEGATVAWHPGAVHLALDRDQSGNHEGQVHEAERLLEALEGAIGGAVIDDDDLKAGVAQREHRLDALDDERLLVVCRQ